jgi:hypothetical protein
MRATEEFLIFTNLMMLDYRGKVRIVRSSKRRVKIRKRNGRSRNDSDIDE